MGPNLLMCNENSAYVMPCVTTCAVTSCTHHAVHACRQAGHPYENVACQKLLMDMLFMPAKLYLIKLTASHFSTLNMRIANQNVLKTIPIAMCRGICKTSVQAVDFKRPVGTEILQLQF